MQAALGLSPTMEPESRLHIYKYYYASCPRALSQMNLIILGISNFFKGYPLTIKKWRKSWPVVGQFK